MNDLFKNFSKNNESLFLNEHMLSYDYQPKLVPHRENQQHFIASCIKPLFEKRSGKNLFIFGQPGIGKTVSLVHVLNELNEKTDEIETIYINCWKKDSSHKMAIEICHQLGYKFTHNKGTDELFEEIKTRLNKKSAVIVLDEVDKLSDFQTIYNLLEDIYRKCIFFITNDKKFLISLDARLKSRLSLSELEFKPYNYEQTKDILNERKKYAFVKDAFSQDAFEIIAKKSYEVQDIRTGLFLLQESGNIAEEKSSKKITLEHSQEAVSRLKNYKIKSPLELDEEEKEIVELIKNNVNKDILQIYEEYKKKNDKSIRTFQRKIKELAKNKIIFLDEAVSKKGGKTYNLRYVDKKLVEF